MFLIFVLILAPGILPSQETVEQILARTEAVYQNRDSFQFSGIISCEWRSRDQKPRIFQESFQCFRGAGGRLRYQRGLGISKILALTDGRTSYLYLADKGHYQKDSSPDLKAFVGSCMRVSEASWIFPSIALLEKYQNLRTRFHDAKLLGNQAFAVDGGTVTCLVLEGVMDPVDMDAVRGTRKTQLWIDKDKHLIRREISSGTTSDHPAADEHLTETISFNIAKPGEAPEEDLFVFKPPQGTMEVKQLLVSESGLEKSERISPDGRPFAHSYQPPFAAMRNFELPSVGGKPVSLNQFRGKFVFLDFWATWCVPCHQQMKDLVKILGKSAGADVVVLGFNDEAADITYAFVRNRPSGYPLLMDTGGNLAALYGADALPTLVLLDRSGRIILKKTGRQTFEQIEELLKRAGL